MKNQLFCILFFLLCAELGFGQTKEIDSLKSVLNDSSLHDTVRIKTNFALAGKFGGYSLDSLKKYTYRAEELSKLNDDYLLEAVYYYLGLYHDHIDNIGKAKEYFLKAISLVDSTTNGKKLAKVLSSYANVLNETTELNEKITYNIRALKLREAIGDTFDLGQSQFNLAVLYSNTGFDSLSVKYLRSALKNGEAVGNKIFIGYVLNSLTMYALKNENFKEAELYLLKSEKICNETDSNMLCYNSYLRKGTYLDKLERYAEAEKAYMKSVIYAEQRKIPGDIMFVYASLGKHYVLSDEPYKAIESFKKFEKNKSNNIKGKISQLAYSNWSKAERMVGNYKKSNEYLQRYIDIKDSMNLVNNKNLLISSEAKYQTEKKDKELAEQKLELADQQLAIQESNSKTRTMSILIISLLLGSILLWFSFRQRQKRMEQQLVAIEREQEVKTLESLMEGEEKERLRIAKELHDGVNGDLAAIKFKLTSLLETNNKVINEAVAMIDTSSEQVRAISHNLVPPSLRDFNLLEAVDTYCDNMNAIHAPEITFQHLGNEILLEKKQEANIFRIIQELVTNSIKHAEAKEIHVQLSNVEDNLQLTVEDDGKGFDVSNVKSDGIGMQNIKSRVEYLGALMDVKSDAKGTSFTITIVDNPQKA